MSNLLSHQSQAFCLIDLTREGLSTTLEKWKSPGTNLFSCAEYVRGRIETLALIFDKAQKALSGLSGPTEKQSSTPISLQTLTLFELASEQLSTGLRDLEPETDKNVQAALARFEGAAKIICALLENLKTISVPNPEISLKKEGQSTPKRRVDNVKRLQDALNLVVSNWTENESRYTSSEELGKLLGCSSSHASRIIGPLLVEGKIAYKNTGRVGGGGYHPTEQYLSLLAAS